MAGVGQRAALEEDRTSDAESPPALRIDTDVFVTLTEATDEERGDPPILGWFDCWRP